MSDDIAALLRFYLKPEPWMDYAACKGMGPHDFFPERGQSKRPALEVCARCPVTVDCGKYREASESEYGIWGGVLHVRNAARTAPVQVVAQPDSRRQAMIPKSLSATSIQVYEECPKRFEAEYLLRAPSVGGSAASLGTACHEALEPWVADGHYLAGHTNEWSVMQALYDQSYWAVFADGERYDEGANLLKNWLARQNWTGRTVLSTEKKLNFTIKSSAGDIPFNYIMDRKDRLANGDIEVVDYKSLSQPVSPDKLRHKIQARAYALAAQLEHPEANRIWVTFDMLRFEPVGVVFTKEENRATWKYLHALAERIIADSDPQEKLGNACRFCVRKAVCESLVKHGAAGGSLAISDPAAAAKKRHELSNAKSAITALIVELDEFLIEHCRTNDLMSFDTDDFEVNVGVSGRRQADAATVAPIIGPDLMARYANLSIANIDSMLKGSELTDDQKSQLKQSIKKVYGDATVKINEKSPF